jgi:hypothetical protein
LPPGAAPGQPVDGNIWTANFGLHTQVGGKTIGPIGNGTIVGPSSTGGTTFPFSPHTGGTALSDSGVSLESQAAYLVLVTPGAAAGPPAFRWCARRRTNTMHRPFRPILLAASLMASLQGCQSASTPSVDSLIPRLVKKTDICEMQARELVEMVGTDSVTVREACFLKDQH